MVSCPSPRILVTPEEEGRGRVEETGRLLRGPWTRTRGLSLEVVEVAGEVWTFVAWMGSWSRPRWVEAGLRVCV